MRFLAITLIVHAPDPPTGTRRSTTARFREVVDNAIMAEELGFASRPFPGQAPPADTQVGALGQPTARS
ncbi:hypothetical protein CC117_00135 [Parafrankia colletiae]|uniref:Uncharacterized protein n=1 Tax=Parafrankia colletiae TaxID=573497 RepID=A0A1S1RL42_9ACTN|nr:hypothetical protein CC117_00135 [Parafrankia colletiae]